MVVPGRVIDRVGGSEGHWVIGSLGPSLGRRAVVCVQDFKWTWRCVWWCMVYGVWCMVYGVWCVWWCIGGGEVPEVRYHSYEKKNKCIKIIQSKLVLERREKRDSIE